MGSIGDELRTARESRRLSIPDVSEQIHIRSLYLQAIEEEDWSSIAAPVYVRGFIRTYARFLGLDAEDAVARFNVVIVEPEPEARLSEPAKFSRRSASFPGWTSAACCAGLLLVFFVGYNYYRLQKSTQQAILAEAPIAPESRMQISPHAEEPRRAASPRGEAGKEFSFKVQQRSWLRVVLDGRDVMEGVFEPGTQRAFAGKTATVRAGNAGGIAIAINGRDVGMLGPSGGVVERTFTSAQK